MVKTIEDSIERAVKLERELLEVMKNINDNLKNNGGLSDPTLDYCVRNFIHEYTCIIPIVREFNDKVKLLRKQKILYFYSDSIKTGIISGQCKFKDKGVSKDIYVPVARLLSFNKRKRRWEREKNGLLLIEPKIFSNLPFLIKNVDNGKDGVSFLYSGGESKKNGSIYLGDVFVERRLKENSIRGINEPDIKIPFPNY